MSTEQIILDLLHAQEPCTLAEIVDEVLLQSTIPRRCVLAAVMAAIVNLRSDNRICAYDQEIDDPISDYAWVASQYDISDLRIHVIA
jgi:hypothetical protein